MLKRYLNSQETNSVLTTQFMCVECQKMLNDWSKRENLTKEEAKNLKYAITYSNKFFEAIISRLEDREKIKILRRSKDFEVRFLDRYGLEVLNRNTSDRLKIAAVPREQFSIWCEEIMDVNCKNCNKCFSGCDLYDVFYDNLVPEFDGQAKNCRYAYEKK